eukprot:jgi/Chrzof1/15214/Cz09g31260.t1
MAVLSEPNHPVNSGQSTDEEADLNNNGGAKQMYHSTTVTEQAAPATCQLADTAKRPDSLVGASRSNTPALPTIFEAHEMCPVSNDGMVMDVDPCEQQHPIYSQHQHITEELPSSYVLDTMPVAAALSTASNVAGSPDASCSHAQPAMDPAHDHKHASNKEWLYQLVSCPYLFKPCPDCAPHHTGREVLITYYDVDDPSHGYCTYCPGRATRPQLLQIRRSTYHEVVKASDVARMVDVSGIQHYVINGSKVLFLCPRPQPRPPKGVVAPARCVVDGRQLMDSGSTYCSIRCKLETEDSLFNACFPHHDDAHMAAGSSSPGHHGHKVKTTVVKRPAVPIGGDSGSDDQEQPRWGSRSKRQRHLPGSRGVGLRRADSPCASVDSQHSTAFTYRWQHKRKGEPTRSPLQ